MRQLAMPLLCLLLTACQTTGLFDEDSPFQVLPTGSRLVLQQTLTIPAHITGVLLQGGRVVRSKELNQYYPHCRLEVHDVRETEQTVAADEFLVRRAQHVTQTVALPGPIKTARRNVGSGSNIYVFKTILELYSVRQPQVRWLTCLQWGDPSLDRHVTTREIRQTLGEIITLQLPAAVPGAAS